MASPESFEIDQNLVEQQRLRNQLSADRATYKASVADREAIFKRLQDGGTDTDIFLGMHNDLTTAKAEQVKAEQGIESSKAEMEAAEQAISEFKDQYSITDENDVIPALMSQLEQLRSNLLKKQQEVGEQDRVHAEATEKVETSERYFENFPEDRQLLAETQEAGLEASQNPDIQNELHGEALKMNWEREMQPVIADFVQKTLYEQKDSRGEKLGGEVRVGAKHVIEALARRVALSQVGYDQSAAINEDTLDQVKRSPAFRAAMLGVIGYQNTGSSYARALENAQRGFPENSDATVLKQNQELLLVGSAVRESLKYVNEMGGNPSNVAFKLSRISAVDERYDRQKSEQERYGIVGNKYLDILNAFQAATAAGAFEEGQEKLGTDKLHQLGVELGPEGALISKNTSQTERDQAIVEFDRELSELKGELVEAISQQLERLNYSLNHAREAVGKLESAQHIKEKGEIPKLEREIEAATKAIDEATVDLERLKSGLLTDDVIEKEVSRAGLFKKGLRRRELRDLQERRRRDIQGLEDTLGAHRKFVSEKGPELDQKKQLIYEAGGYEYSNHTPETALIEWRRQLQEAEKNIERAQERLRKLQVPSVE